MTQLKEVFKKIPLAIHMVICNIHSKIIAQLSIKNFTIDMYVSKRQKLVISPKYNNLANKFYFHFLNV